jgi:hypothetical protein
VICQLLGFESTLPLAGLRCFMVHASGEEEARRGILGENTSSSSNMLLLGGLIIKMASADVIRCNLIKRLDLPSDPHDQLGEEHLKSSMSYC